MPHAITSQSDPRRSIRRPASFSVMPWLAAALFLATAPSASLAGSLAEARKLELTGKYAEAADEYAALAEANAIAAALGQARCLTSQGETTAAEELLAKAQAAHADSADLAAELAATAFRRGDYEACRRWLADARKINDDQLTARWIAAELARVTGQLDEAGKAYEWFVDYFNGHDVTDPDELRLVGLAAAQFARWNKLADQFQFIINDLYPAALEAEPGYWPAHYETGLLFLEKYNQAEAARAFDAALKINPHAAEVHAAVAELLLQNYNLDAARASLDTARELNPKLASIAQLEADWTMANFQMEKAVEALQPALDINPADEGTLGRLAAVYAVTDGCPADLAGTRLGKLIDEVNARNPHAGEFYLTLATRLEERRKFDAAERFFMEAIARMPQLVGPQAGLGMMFMRIGREEEAKRLLEAAFDSDPFHVRASNMLKVLEVLADYTTLETEHFQIRYDRNHDKILAHYLARNLEQVYPELCEKFGYQPPGRSLFEVFCQARNTDGHGWFSARMIGLPYVGTVGACAGKTVALTSPNDKQGPFHWARVVRHEFVHVINLQQTDFNVPHWFTEGLAVHSEGYPRPQQWNELLAQRVPRGEVFTLDNINFGFIRPKSSDDWAMAYCQAELYAEHLLQVFGPQAFARLLAAFGQTQDTKLAIERAFNVPAAQFEESYKKYLNETVASLGTLDAPESLDLAELQRAREKSPDDIDVAARLAQALVDRKAYAEAKTLVDQVQAAEPAHPLAAYVRARLSLVTGETEVAIAALEGGLDPAKPHPRVLLLLASLKLKAGDHAGASELYEIGRAREPWQSRWLEGLARAWLLAGDNEKLAPVLEQLAQLDTDNLIVRKKLARLAADRGDWPAASRWAQDCLSIDVRDLEAHRQAATAAWNQGAADEAAWELAALAELAPDDIEQHRELADAAGRTEIAAAIEAALNRLAEREPDFRAGATAILLQWKS